MLSYSQAAHLCSITVHCIAYQHVCFGTHALYCRMQDADLHFLGAVPEDKLLRAVRLDEVMTALDAQYTFGSKVQLDQVRACC
mgnify:FL=1